MPYESTYQDAELFLEYQGIKIYHTYKDNDIERGRRVYVFDNKASSDEDEAFDVRELAQDPNVLALLNSGGIPLDSSREAGQMAIFRAAIDAGLIECGEDSNEVEEAPEIPGGESQEAQAALSIKTEIVAMLCRLYSATTENVTTDVNIAGIDGFLVELTKLGY
jgi:hypothetical protein